MSVGPPSGQGAASGAVLRPLATSHVMTTPGPPLVLHVMLPVGLWKTEPTSAAGAASMRAFASSKECGAPRCLPTASEVGTALLVAEPPSGWPTSSAPAWLDVGAPPGASTVTVTVRRGVGRSVMPHADRASGGDRDGAPRRSRRHAASGRRRLGRERVRSSMARKSGTGRAPSAGVTYSGGVLRGLLSPKWVGLFAVVLVVVAACTLLGLWQLGVARDEGHKEAVASASQLQPAPLQQVTQAHVGLRGGVLQPPRHRHGHL